jgi:hypothetical protein
MINQIQLKSIITFPECGFSIEGLLDLQEDSKTA